LKAPVFLLLVAALAGGCKEEPVSRWADAAAAAAQPSPSPSAPPVPKATGASFNAFFPKDVVFTQEKDDFAEAKVTKDGADLAVLSIKDSVGDTAPLAKFKDAKDRVAGHPLVTVGKNQSALLVKERYQVKVSSQTLDEAARKAWLERFDLAGLEKMEPKK